MDAIGRLAAGVAHDLNNLLTIIIGESQDLIEHLPPDDPARRASVQIVNAGEYAAALARNLLAFSRRQILSPQVLDLNAIVTRLTSLLQRLLGDGIRLAIRVNADPCAVRADPGQLERLIMNLVVNARDAMPDGGTLAIETAEAVIDARDAAARPGLAPGRYIRLTVSDTGRGMDAHTKAHLFEPFFTTKRAGRGTGLGLATVYGVVTQSGGHILVDSEPGQGAVFRVYLPSRPADEIDPASAPTQPPREHGTESILLVDDDRGVREFATRALTARGYIVLAAAPREALQIGDEHPDGVDLLLTDIVMPGLSGSALARALSARQPRMQVVYMSGYTAEAIVDQGVLDPSVAFITKPFTARGLASKIREALDRPAR
jgi:two-component system cell cycle sensor histidine kinase/response regulator CckA